MEYEITITPYNKNEIKISCEVAPTRYYKLDKWTIGAAVENYVQTELSCEDD